MSSEKNVINDTALLAQNFSPEFIDNLKEKISQAVITLGKDVTANLPDDLKGILEELLGNLPNVLALLENFKGNLLELLIVFFFQKDPMDDSKGRVEGLLKFLSETKSKELSEPLERIFITQIWSTIPKPITMLAGYSYRSSDGSGYSKLRLYSDIGKAGSEYSRSARILRSFGKLPKPEDIFDKVMRRDAFRSHPSGISATLFYLATIISLDLFNSRSNAPRINLNSSYLDLSPLYGSNEKEQKSVRLYKRGLLKPDTFPDSRALLQPPGVGSLLILFSRNHNYIAKRLLEINHGGRFKDSSQQDEDLFQTARLINCGYYVKIILRNYLRTILGFHETNSTYIIDPTKPYDKSWLLKSIPTGIGNQVSLEFNYVYRWHPAISKQDEKWVEDEFKRALDIDDPNITPDTFRKKVQSWTRSLSEDPSEWEFGGLKRKDGKFQDSDVAREFIHGTEQIAGAFGAYGIPKFLRVIEIAGIETARNLGVCSFNDFRRFLNLKPYDSFEEMTNNNTKLANDLRELYGDDIENVELYPGLMTEKTKPSRFGSALAHPYSVGYGILTDAINVVRNDRFLTDDFNEHNLAYWDWDELKTSSESLASEGILHQLILKHMPNIYKENSVWALYPFTIPERTKENLDKRDLDLKKFDFEKPKIK